MRTISYDFSVNQSIKNVWHILSTEEGIKSFFSPYINIEFYVTGPFEIFFDMTAEPGLRGSEGMHIMAMEAPTMISFTWNNPSKLDTIRNHQTMVNITLEKGSEDQTIVHFINTGFGYSKQWVESYHYFIRAWGSIVLPRLRYALEVEPINWDDPQDYSRFDLNLM